MLQISRRYKHYDTGITQLVPVSLFTVSIKAHKIKTELIKTFSRISFYTLNFPTVWQEQRVWYVCYFERPVLTRNDQTPSLLNQKPIGCSALIVPPPLFCRAWQPLNTTSCGCAAQERRPKLWGRSVVSARHAQISARRAGHLHVYVSKTQSAAVAASLVNMLDHIWICLLRRNWLEDAFTKSLVFFWRIL